MSSAVTHQVLAQIIHSLVSLLPCRFVVTTLYQRFTSWVEATQQAEKGYPWVRYTETACLSTRHIQNKNARTTEVCKLTGWLSLSLLCIVSDVSRRASDWTRQSILRTLYIRGHLQSGQGALEGIKRRPHLQVKRLHSSASVFKIKLNILLDTLIP